MKDNSSDQNKEDEDDQEKENNFSNLTSLKEDPTPEFKEDLSSVMASSKQKFLILAILGLIASYLLVYLLVLKKHQPVDSNIDFNSKTTVENSLNRTSSVVNETAALPALPRIPTIDDPVADQPKEDVVTQNEKENTDGSKTKESLATKIIKEVLPGNQSSQNKADANQNPSLPSSSTTVTPMPTAAINSKDAQAAVNSRLEAKRKSGIMLLSGKQVEKSPEQKQQEADFVAKGNPCLLLPQGKIIDAVIESAVNTDFGGEIRAIVSRDVYAAQGNKVLIPKGSLVFGTYATGFDGVYARIAINWFKIDLANSSYSVNISSPTVDNLGRAGATGKLDTRYKEKLGNAILSSAFNILLAKGLDKIVPPVVSSSTAAKNQALASQLNNVALGIFSDPTIAIPAKIPLICARVQSLIPDPTSQAYISFATTCSNLIVTPSGNPAQDLNSIMAAVSSASASLIANVTNQVTPTQAQQASKQAFIDIAHTIQEVTIRDLPKATVTIDQGSNIRIYVNKDYNFPAAALSKITRIK